MGVILLTFNIRDLNNKLFFSLIRNSMIIHQIYISYLYEMYVCQFIINKNIFKQFYFFFYFFNYSMIYIYVYILFLYNLIQLLFNLIIINYHYLIFLIFVTSHKLLYLIYIFEYIMVFFIISYLHIIL